MLSVRRSHKGPFTLKIYYTIILRFLPPAIKLSQGNVFTPVCHSVHRGEWQTPPWEQTPSGSRHPPYAVHAGRYGQQSGGMHPTGMHSCCDCDCDSFSPYRKKHNNIYIINPRCEWTITAAIYSTVASTWINGWILSCAVLSSCTKCRAIKTKGMVWSNTWVYSKRDTTAHTYRLVVTS